MMAFGVSAGRLASVSTSQAPQAQVAVAVPNTVGAAPWEYAEIWRRQPNVRTMVGFLARNVAQLGLHVYRRVSDEDRQREHDHPLSVLLDQPMPGLTGYRLVERIVSDLAIYDCCYLLKGRGQGSNNMLVPVPAPWVQPLGDNWLQPTGYRVMSRMQVLDLDRRDVVAIHGYDPDDLRTGCSPMEALRTLLAEEAEAAAFRSQMWRSGARMSGVVTRPSDAPSWSPDARDRWIESWRAYQRDGGKSGGTPLLEDGMQYQPIAFNPQQAQYLEARKLTREEVAAAYFIPPPLVGILDNANYSNVREMHKQLYQDTLGPIMRVIEQEVRLQILPDLPDHDGVYVEFNVADKLKGSFEEQAAALQTSVGRPWMTAAEARARMNLPPIEGADELVTPLNVIVGGQASPTDSAPDDTMPGDEPKALAKANNEGLGTRDSERDALADRFSRLLSGEASRLRGLLQSPGDVALHTVDRHQVERLTAGCGFRLAQVGAQGVLSRYSARWDAEVMRPWLAKAATSHAEAVARSLTKALRAASEQATGVEGRDWPAARDAALNTWTGRAGVWATTIATESVSFGASDAAGAAGLTVKTWNARETRHAALDGETIGVDGLFSNGLRWPADPAGHADEVAGCVCDVTYTRTAA